MTSIRLKNEESWYASMDCKVQKSGPWVCFYGGHSTGYKLGNHPKNIEPCAHRARTVRAPCAHRATTPPLSVLFGFRACVWIFATCVCVRVFVCVCVQRFNATGTPIAYARARVC